MAGAAAAFGTGAVTGAEPTFLEATGFGHGKVILLGEHAVVHGHAALAAGLAAGIEARVRRGTGLITAPAWSLSCHADDDSKPARAIRAVFSTLALDANPRAQPSPSSAAPAAHDVVIDARIPPAAGLGSSAALATAVARAAVALGGTPADRIREAVAAAEVIFHGNPSGIDAAAARAPAVGMFTRKDGWRPIDVPPLEICVGLSGQARDTAALVASVSALVRDHASAADALNRLGEAAHAGEEALRAGDLGGLGQLFDRAHAWLSNLQVSTPELDALVHAARGAGALGAKLTGAGGGGAVIALAPGRNDEVLARWRAMGYAGFATRVGG